MGDALDIAERLQQLVKQTIRSQREFSEIIGISPNTFSHYATGKRNLPHDVAIRIAKHTNCNLHWLLTGEGEMFITEHKTISTENVHIMPIEAEIAAGEPVEVTMERHNTYSLDRALIPDVSNSLCFRVNGHSMEPGIEHQDIVIINKDCNWHDKDGLVCAIRLNGDIAIKRIMQEETQKQLVLVSDNRSYPPIIVDPKHSDVTLIGTLQMVIRSVV